MHRDDNANIERAGTDSFLDITTNIVGILIILVMVVGMRAQNPIVQASTTPAPTQAELETLDKQAAAIEYDVRRISQQVQSVDDDTTAKSKARETLATMISAAEKEIGDRRAQLDSSKQEDFDLHRQAEADLATLDRDTAELKELEAQKPSTIEVHHYPTPISRTVLGHEVHFQVLGGRINYIPFDEFLDDMRSNLRGSGIDYNNISDKVNVIGPRNGFECRYVLDIRSERGHVMSIGAKEIRFVPISDQEGETLQEALSPRSNLSHTLAMYSPHQTTVTLWTYPDSFEMYRQLKEELHRLGYATAARPMLVGEFIGASEDGSKSSAQ